MQTAPTATPEDPLAVLLHAVAAGEPGARDRLFAAAYGELRQLARARLRDGGRGTVLDTTALVHECFLRITRSAALQPGDRRAFFAYASQTMRSVIVDTVRERLAQCRGGDLARVTLGDTLGQGLADPATTAADEVMQVHHALLRLAEAEPRLAQVVEMRYFGGYEDTEIAAALGLTDRTVRRDWQRARALLSLLLAE
jgi:RNA polymerase sigma factor (TIGR02999 family)